MQFYRSNFIRALTVTRYGLGVENVGLLQRQLVMLLGLIAFDALNLGYI